MRGWAGKLGWERKHCVEDVVRVLEMVSTALVLWITHGREPGVEKLQQTGLVCC
jgi:hypothetical protein